MGLKFTHHSLTDWDYPTPGPYITLEQYISPPSCLAARYKSGVIDRQGWAVCNLSPAYNIYDGRIVSYLRFTAPYQRNFCWMFRMQALPSSPTAPPSSCYFYGFFPTTITLYRIGTNIASYTFSPALSIETWYRFRATWWQYLQPDMTKMCRHTLEFETSTGWIKIIDKGESINSFATSSINKIGFIVQHNSIDKDCCLDNTELWKRTE